MAGACFITMQPGILGYALLLGQVFEAGSSCLVLPCLALSRLVDWSPARAAPGFSTPSFSLQMHVSPRIGIVGVGKTLL